MLALDTFISTLENKNIIAPQDIEFVYLWEKLDPDITLEQLSALLSTFYYKEQGNCAVNQKMYEHFLELIGIKKKYSLKEIATKSNLISDPESYAPFVFSQNLLYQQKWYEYENTVANWIVEKSESTIELNENLFNTLKENYLPEENDLQQQAIYKSFIQSILFLTGGPGTGKTYTIHQIINAHKEVFGDSYVVKIAAPTGKAVQKINNWIEVNEDLSLKAVTVHQLLGAKDSLTGFTHTKNAIIADVVIIDEASMMDLNLWYYLIMSLSKKTRLIIVGDPHQLASVDSGSVLNDICITCLDSSVPKHQLKDSFIELTKTHRFTNKSDIQLLADAIKSMDVETTLAYLLDPKYSTIQWLEPTSTNLKKVINDYGIKPAINPNNQSYAILSVLRKGYFGCENLNKMVERELKKIYGVSQNQEWFNFRLIMINKNDYSLGIQNGEIGTYIEESGNVNFSGNRFVPINKIKNYESGYCVTVHKSQGSEYNQVAIILPDKLNPILTKEILYTAVTRARGGTLILGSKELLEASIKKQLSRASGMLITIKNLITLKSV